MKIKKFLFKLFLVVSRLLFGPIAVWIKYLKSHTKNSSVVADIGGGNGFMANFIASKVEWFFILDKEGTSRGDADNSIYAESLSHAYRARLHQNIIPVKGDAIHMPFADASIDVIASSELIEHLNSDEKELFLKESYRTLRAGGIFVMMTPNSDYSQTNRFWLPDLSRKLIPRQWVLKLPGILRGPWLEQTVQQWEAKVGHYDGGCNLDDIRSSSKNNGFKEINHRFLHTPLTFFWYQLMFTFPILYMLFMPLVRFFYLLESLKNKQEKGASFMIAFQKVSHPEFLLSGDSQSGEMMHGKVLIHSEQYKYKYEAD